MVSTKTKRIPMVAAVVAAALMLALLPLAPAQAAHPGGGATAGIANLDGGIGTCGNFTFGGVGAAATADPSVAGPNVSASGTYCNPTTVAGDAAGTLTFSGLLGTESCNFSWDRVGVIALISFSGGSCGLGVQSAVAAFAPNPVANPDGSISAVVVGGGIF